MSAPAGDSNAAGAFRAALAEELRVHMTRKQVTGRELARRLHVSSQWISQRTRAVVPMDADDMEMVAGALGITVLGLVTDAARRVSEGAETGRAIRGYRSVIGDRFAETVQVRAMRHLYIVPAPAEATVTRWGSRDRTRHLPLTA